MEKLLRTRVGQFDLKDSLKLGEIEELVHSGQIEEHIVAVETVFSSYDRVRMLPQWDLLLYNGNPFTPDKAGLPPGLPLSGESVRVCDSQGKFLGIYQFDQEKGRFQPQKMFLGGE